MNDTKSWQAADARELYNIPHWGEGYFDVAADGHLLVRPYRKRSPVTIDLHELAQKLQQDGLALPVLVRFTDILHDRVDALTGAFSEVIDELRYAGKYTAVFPIKVNQQRVVCEEIVRHGGARVGLEAGSKPELSAVLALAPTGSIIVCNGYKDRAYIRRALIGQKLGHRVYIVVEKLSELPLVIEESKTLEVSPLIGLRVKLAGSFTSTQQNTGGDKSKFGLACAQVLEACSLLREAGKLDCVRMVHFHLGSQVANVQDVVRGMREAARFFAELRALGAPVDVVDVGGGLGVDYEGTRSRSYCSMNYTLREYARNIVRTLQDICRETGQPEPALISESGRALTAHHAVLITQVIDRESPPAIAIEGASAEAGRTPPPGKDDPAVLLDLHALLSSLEARGPLECLHDASSALAEAQTQYTHGLLSLPQRAYAEKTYFAVCRALIGKLDPGIRAHRDALDELREKLADKYFCNLSIFQSMPDAWALDQVFPILPIHRLDELPSQRATLCDLTCDSDGRIDAYVDREGVMPTLALHALREGETYLLGFFMIGAYQEILGDMHNLFGDTNAVNVRLDGKGGWITEGAERGDRTDELLRYVHFAPEELTQAYRRKLDESKLPAAERDAIFRELEAGLSGYTYLG